MRKPDPRFLPILCYVWLALSVCCAKRGAPPGGPEDRTPPHVVEVTPASGSVSVPLDSHMSVQFSERMKTRTVETGIVVSPACRWKERYWKKNRYFLVPEAALRANTTYLISVSNNVKDTHGVTMKSTFVSGFATGDTIDAGIISGTVKWKNVTVEAAVVELFDADRIDSIAGFPLIEPLCLTLSGSRGLYEIPFVDTEKRYRVFSFLDKNVNSAYDQGEDIGCYAGDVVFGDASELSRIDVTLCGEILCGAIKGRVDTSSVADTVRVSVAARSLSDTSLIYRASPAISGEFEIKCVEPGRYVVEVFAQDTFWVELGDTLGVESCSVPPEVRIDFIEGD